LAVAAYVASAANYSQPEVTKASYTEYMSNKGFDVNFGSMELPNSHIMKQRLGKTPPTEEEKCSHYNDGHFEHQVCVGHGWYENVWWEWEYDVASGTDAEYGYSFGNGWSKSQGNKWTWKFDDQWALHCEDYWYSDEWHDSHGTHTTNDETNSANEHDFVHKVTHGKSGDYEIYQTHEKPGLYELVHRYQFHTGEWW